MLFERTGAGHDYEELHVVQDTPSGLRAIIAIHSTKRGPAGGGIRRLAYASEEAALEDALKLAEMMSLKYAAADFDAGGAKTVILDHPALDVPAAYRRLGRAIEALGGRYCAGGDVGTGPAELAHVREATKWVVPLETGGTSTALGVLAGIRGFLRQDSGDASPRGRRFVVQGLGAVGMEVARLLLAQRAVVIATDTRADAVAAAVALGARAIPPEDALRTKCDVLVPCALGGVLTRETTRMIAARAICGSANDQLADDDAARILASRGIRYVPDFLVNAGAAIEGMLIMRGMDAAAVGAEMQRHYARIEREAESVLKEALAAGLPPSQVAEARARARLAG